jgi:hypothetical protein
VPYNQKKEIPQEIIVVIQKMYENNEVQVKAGNMVSTSFGKTKGLKQGCGLSPTSFKIYLESAEQEMLKYGITNRRQNNTSSFCG